MLRPYVLRISLLDTDGKRKLSTDAKADPREWLPGEDQITESLLLPASITTGNYALAVIVVDPSGQGRPFGLAIDAPAQEGRYPVGTVRGE